MKGGDLVTELVAHIDVQRHFVGAITVIVDQDVARQHPGERLHRQVAIDRLAAVALLLVGDRLGPGRAVDSDITHAGRRHPALGAINPLRILAARHFPAIGRTGNFHPLYRARRTILAPDRTYAYPSTPPRPGPAPH